MSEKYISCETQDGKIASVKSENLLFRISAYGLLMIEDKIVVIQAHLPLWEFPGGEVLPDETLKGGLAREFKEETGLVVFPKKLILERESFYLSPKGNAYHTFQHFFEVETTEILVNNFLDRKNIKLIAVSELKKTNMNVSAFDALCAYKSGLAVYSFLSIDSYLTND